MDIWEFSLDKYGWASGCCGVGVMLTTEGVTIEVKYGIAEEWIVKNGIKLAKENEANKLLKICKDVIESARGTL